jgi:hypothetical protein
MTWFDAAKKGSCSQCVAPVAEGDRMWAVRRGYYVCEADGLLREAAKGEMSMGAMEAGVMESLKAFPPEATSCALAQSMIYLARLLDRDEVNPRDAPNFEKEIRQTVAQLECMYPPEPEDDITAAAQKKRARKMAGLDEGEWQDG